MTATTEAVDPGAVDTRRDEALLSVRGLRKHFPITQGGSQLTDSAGGDFQLLHTRQPAQRS